MLSKIYSSFHKLIFIFFIVITEELDADLALKEARKITAKYQGKDQDQEKVEEDIEHIIYQKKKNVSLCCCKKWFTVKFEKGDYKHKLKFD